MQLIDNKYALVMCDLMYFRKGIANLYYGSRICYCVYNTQLCRSMHLEPITATINCFQTIVTNSFDLTVLFHEFPEI